MWVGMVLEETVKALGASMDEDPQISGVPGTDLSSSHSLALWDDGT